MQTGDPYKMSYIKFSNLANFVQFSKIKSKQVAKIWSKQKVAATISLEDTP